MHRRNSTYALLSIGADIGVWKMLNVKAGRPSKQATDEQDKRKAKQLENLLDNGPIVRTSVVFTEDQHRRYKIYLAQNKKKLKEDLIAHVEECIKDIE